MCIIVWEYQRCLSQPGWVRDENIVTSIGWEVKTEWYTGLFSQYTVLVSLLSASQLLIEDVPSFMTWLSMPSMWRRSSHILWTFLSFLQCPYLMLQSADYLSLFPTLCPSGLLFMLCFFPQGSLHFPSVIVHSSDFNFIAISFMKLLLSLPTIHFSVFVSLLLFHFGLDYYAFSF